MRGQRHRLKNIHRKRSVSTAMQTRVRGASSFQMYGGAHQTTRSAECELEQLKRERNVIMIELGRLGGQHNSAHQQMKSISDRLQAMEMRQQQMVAFVARTMCAPAFLFQYVNQAVAADYSLEGQQKFLDCHMQDSIRSGSRKRRLLMHPDHCAAERGATAGAYHDQLQQQHIEEHASSCEINQKATATPITTSDNETTASYDHKLLVQLNLENDTNSAMCLDNFMQGGGAHANDSIAYHNQQLHERIDHHEEFNTTLRSSGAIAGHVKMKMKQQMNEGFTLSNYQETHEHLRMMDLNVQPIGMSEKDFTYARIPTEPRVAHGGSPAKYNDTPHEDLESELFWEHLLGPVGMQAEHNTSRSTFVGCYSNE